MGYFSFAYQIFNVVVVIIVSGMPVALARMVAERTGAGPGGQHGRGILKQALVLFSVIGLTGSGILLILAQFISRIAGSEPSRYCIMALAPSAFFIAMMAAYRGYYQGLSDMASTAASQITEAFCKLAIGISAAYYLYTNNYPPEIVAAGAIGGVSVGTVAGFAVLAVIGKRRGRAERRVSIKERGIKRKIVLTALPITLGAFFANLINTIDAMLIMNRLQDAGFTATESTELYGAYSGYAVTMYAFPFALTSAVAASVLPLVASATARGAAGTARLKRSVNTALRITAIIAFPSAALFGLLPKPVMSLLFSRASDVAIAAPLLAGLSGATVLSAFTAVTSAILQGAGCTNVPMAATAIGGLAKLASNYFLIGNRNINIRGAPIGTTVCYLIVFLINITAICKKFGFMPKISEFIFKPAVCGAFSAFAAYWIHTGMIRYLSPVASIAASLFAAAALYVFALVFTGTIKREDRDLIPFYPG
jgi:stage V sporulation protein B